jgi:hypothetical protein
MMHWTQKKSVDREDTFPQERTYTHQHPKGVCMIKENRKKAEMRRKDLRTNTDKCKKEKKGTKAQIQL